MEVFKFFKNYFSRYYIHDTLKTPFKAATKEEWEALSDEEAFHQAFPELNADNWKNLLSKNDLDVSQAVYCLRIKNMTGYMEGCHFCGDKRCEGCPLPFDANLTYKDLLMKVGTSGNDSFFGADAYKRGKLDIVFDIVWASRTPSDFFTQF